MADLILTSDFIKSPWRVCYLQFFFIVTLFVWSQSKPKHIIFPCWMIKCFTKIYFNSWPPFGGQLLQKDIYMYQISLTVYVTKALRCFCSHDLIEVITVVVIKACLHNTTKNCERCIMCVTWHMAFQFWFATQNYLSNFKRCTNRR